MNKNWFCIRCGSLLIQAKDRNDLFTCSNKNCVHYGYLSLDLDYNENYYTFSYIK